MYYHHHHHYLLGSAPRHAAAIRLNTRTLLVMVEGVETSSWLASLMTLRTTQEKETLASSDCPDDRDSQSFTRVTLIRATRFLTICVPSSVSSSVTRLSIISIIIIIMSIMIIIIISIINIIIIIIIIIIITIT